ncbi:MAG: hypothetical protein GWP56_10665 [Gammaproteobacteria bacterium]|jgi:hypothetical protein|nr:hypothetical protein [Gammaproteobacteria bacterium]
MSNAEQGIGQAQIAAAKTQTGETDGLNKVQKWNIAYLNDRIFIYLGAIAFLGLLVVWATASSALVLYGSLALVILLTILWGVARIKRNDRINAERARQVKALQAENPD